jgi:tetratricopeptide (TPR) repeat protein
VGSAFEGSGFALCAALIVAAPLLAGTVHRGTMMALMTAAGLALLATVAGLTGQRRKLRVDLTVIVPLAFLIVPLIQSVPLPFGLRRILDPIGTTLLGDNALSLPTAWALSLDPPGTRVYAGRAAVALVVFLIAFHAASGRSRRHLLIRFVGAAGVAAVLIGLGHRLFGVAKLYGFLNIPRRSLMAGPFVNPNHTAEFLELAAFVCLACALQRPTALNRVGWLIATLLCASGAVATLSRAPAAGLMMGVIAFGLLRYFSGDAPTERRAAVSLAWGGLVLGLVVLAGFALGADALVDRFKADSVSGDVRLRLWRDSLHVLAMHPLGIGRGAFDRVYPIYRQLQTPFPLRFAFVENEPLQLLIDSGWLFYGVMVATLLFVGWRVIRRGRRDRIEAALVAGLVAVLVHGVFDFGLETLGVLVPFTAILATVLGRLTPPADQAAPPAPRAPLAVGFLVAVAFGGTLFGAAATAHRSFDDFDELLTRQETPAARRALLTRAQETHPLDYFYALSGARLLPLVASPGDPSPRLHALNRAMRLCPSCETVHVEVARNLWKMGRRRQALLEWRTAVDLRPVLYRPALDELFLAGATPEELASLTSANLGRVLELVSFLSGAGRVAEAFAVLDQAEALGASPAEMLVSRAELQLQKGQLDAAQESIERAQGLQVQDPRLELLRSRLVVARKGADGADEAVAILNAAATRYPTELRLQSERIGLIYRFEKWNHAAAALEGLKMALYSEYGAATDAHTWAGRVNARLGRWSKSLDEYRIALADRPSDVSVWMEFGRAAESAGRRDTAREAYFQAARLSPNNPEIVSAQRALDAKHGADQVIENGERRPNL